MPMTMRLFLLTLVVGCQPDNGEPEAATQFASATSAVTLNVPGDFASVDDAVLAAAIGDEILLAEGTYATRVILGTSVHIRGAGMGRTEIRGRMGVSRGVDATFSDLSFVGEGQGSAIGGFRPGAITVQRCEIRGYESGIAMGSPERPLTVLDSRITGNVRGISVNTTRGLIANNEILNNTRNGINVGESALQVIHNTVVGNAFNAGDDDIAGGIAFEVTAGSVTRNNIVVGNAIGLNCMDCQDVFDHNAVWGNLEDYFGAAAADPTDVRVDPRFVDPAAGDFHLRADSTCVDAGIAVDLDADAEGAPRSVGEGPDLGAYERGSMVVTVVVNEVMANPLDEGTGEYIELYN
jgi:hypothetical protein